MTFDKIVFMVFYIILSHHYFNVTACIKILSRENNNKFYYIRNNTKDYKRNFIHKKINVKKKCKNIDNMLVIKKINLNSTIKK